MKYRTHGLLASALAVAFLVTCWGCGVTSGQSSLLVPVKGKVTYKGRPVTKGLIRFEPDGYGRAAMGSLQSDGTFVLSTAGSGDGVVVGEHRVSISGFDKPLAKDRTLKKYGLPNLSHLTAQVDAEHTEFNFDLR